MKFKRTRIHPLPERNSFDEAFKATTMDSSLYFALVEVLEKAPNERVEHWLNEVGAWHSEFKFKYHD